MKKNQLFWLLALLVVLTVTVFTTRSGHVKGQEEPVPGTWTGTALFGAADDPNAADFEFELSESGNITRGSIKLIFSYEGMSRELRRLMVQYGCVVYFGSLNAASVEGKFVTATEAEGTFSTEKCYLEEYGDLEFARALTGTWQASTEAPVAPLPPADASEAGLGGGGDAQTVADTGRSPLDPPADYDAPPHANDGMSGKELYRFHCEECHGRRGEGDEETPALTDALNPGTIADTMREGPEDMDAFTHEDLPDHHLNLIIDYVIKFNPESTPRTEFITTPE